MADKKAILVLAKGLSLATKGEALDKLNKKAAVLTAADQAGLADAALALGGVRAQGLAVSEALEKAAFVLVDGTEEAVAAALAASNRRTVVLVAADDGVAFYGMGIANGAKVARPVTAADIALTVATLVDLPITSECTAGIIYQVLKDPNMKLNEVKKLQEAIARMESVLERNNREPWDKHDCA